MICIIIQLVHSERLLAAVVLFRHGARQNLHFPTQHPGSLTPTGIRQHYNLGKIYGKRFEQLISKPFNHSSIKAYSTMTERTQISLASFIYGVYQHQGQIIDQNIDPQLLLPPFSEVPKIWVGQQALPLGTPVKQFQNGDFMLNNCSNYNKLLEKNRVAFQRDFESMSNRFSDLLINLNKIFNRTNISIYNVYQIDDFIYCQEYAGLSLPPEITPSIKTSVRFLDMWTNVLAFTGDISRALSTPPLKFIIQTLDNPNRNNITLLSAHDTNILPQLVFFNLTSPKCLQDKFNGRPVQNCVSEIPFASSINFQLLEINGNNFMQMSYNGKVSVLKPYDQWKKQVQNYMLGPQTCFGNM